MGRRDDPRDYEPFYAWDHHDADCVCVTCVSRQVDLAVDASTPRRDR